jgi:hypothetical protein
MNSRSSYAKLCAATLLVGCASGSLDEGVDLSSDSSALTSGAAEALLAIGNDWTAGYCGTVSIANKGTSAVSGWTVVLSMNNSTIASHHSATRSGSTFTPLDWNKTINPGQTIQFGFCANATSSSNYRATMSSFTAGGTSGSGGNGGTGNAGGTGNTGGTAGSGNTGNNGGTGNTGGSGGSSCSATYQAESNDANTGMTKAGGQAVTGGWNLWSDSVELYRDHNFTQGNHRVTVSARGGSVGGASPLMRVTVGGTCIGVVEVPATSYTNYTFTYNASSSGTRRVQIQFTNDFNGTAGDRNLYVDSVAVQCNATGSTASTTCSNSGGSGGSSGSGGTGGSSGSGGTGGGETCPPISGTQGWTSRYWDCCKPHCGWSGNVSSGPALSSCNAQNQSYGSNYGVQSACANGSAYMCYGLTPWAVSSSLAYGYAATPTGTNSCGKCYELQFTGQGQHSANDPGSVALKGKTMIVQSINVGGDVAQGQFDIQVPGGGVGQFNACSSQWGVSSSDLGDQYGGMLAVCRRQLNYSGTLQQTQDCLRQKCNGVFTDAKGLGALRQACLFYADWMMAADNPKMVYKEVTCPAALVNKSALTGGGSTTNACGG